MSNVAAICLDFRWRRCTGCSHTTNDADRPAAMQRRQAHAFYTLFNYAQSRSNLCALNPLGSRSAVGSFYAQNDNVLAELDEQDQLLLVASTDPITTSASKCRLTALYQPMRFPTKRFLSYACITDGCNISRKSNCFIVLWTRRQ